MGMVITLGAHHGGRYFTMEEDCRSPTTETLAETAGDLAEDEQPASDLAETADDLAQATAGRLRRGPLRDRTPAARQQVASTSCSPPRSEPKVLGVRLSERLDRAELSPSRPRHAILTSDRATRIQIGVGSITRSRTWDREVEALYNVRWVYEGLGGPKPKP